MKRLIPFLVLLFSLPLLAQNSARMLSGVNVQTGTTYAFVAQDATRLVTFSNAGAVAANLSSGLTAGFTAGSLFSVQNLGPGSLTITCVGCFIFSNGASGSATLVLGQGQGADIYSAGQNYAALVGASNGGGGGGCIVNPSDGGCALYGTPSIDLFIRSQGGPGTDWLLQLLASALNLKVPLNVNSGSNAGVLSLGCGSDPGVGSNIAIAGPLGGCNPYTIYLPSGVGSGFLFGSANGNKLTLGLNPSINLQADVGGTVLGLANGGTNSTSQQQAAINVLPPIVRNGDLIYGSGGNWTIFSGCTVSTCFYAENGGGTPGWVNTPIPPLDGGTGLTTLTPGCIYKGNGTGAMLCSLMSDDGATDSFAGQVGIAGKVTTYNAQPTVGAGVPYIPATVDSLAQTADIAGSILYTTPISPSFKGTYRVSAYIVVTTVAGTSSTMPTTCVTWTDADNSTVQVLNLTASSTGNALTTFAQATAVIRALHNTNITVKTGASCTGGTGYASNPATTMQYAVHFKAEALL